MVAGFTKVARDVTRFKQAHDELTRVHALAQRRVAELDAVIESMPDAVYIGTAEGITKCNTNALKVLGASSLEDFNARIGELGKSSPSAGRMDAGCAPRNCSSCAR